MKKAAILLLLIFQAIPGLSQNRSFSLKATVVHKKINAPLPYANVFNQRLKTGTATNLEGYFELPNNRTGDTITISYLGYLVKTIIATPDFPRQIQLQPNPSLLAEVVVRSDDSYLYELVRQARKNSRTATKISKTYFYLETKLFGKPVEIIEAYYNGQYANYGTTGLQLKKGRIGLRPINKRYFSSTESSRLFSMYDVFARSHLFPDNPLSIKRGALKKRFSLSLRNTYQEGQSKIYVVNFHPKGKGSDLFHGTLWINQSNDRLLKFSLNIHNSGTHPFTPIGYNRILGVDMEITTSFTPIDNALFLNSADFNYNVSYLDSLGHKLEASTKAFSKAYDYGEKFNLPYFEFTRQFHQDYRNIVLTPYDAVFWEGTTEFRFYDRLDKVERFIKDNHIENNIIYADREDSGQQLQWNYIHWDKNRFKMSQAPVAKIETPTYLRRYNIEKYHLNVKLYLDVNFIRDSLTYQLISILDPAETFYYFYLKNTDHAFMNMYFDLMEVQKRKLEAELKLMNHPTVEQLDALHQTYSDNFKREAEKFAAETRRGERLRKMAAWSDYIYDQLAIDNLKLFGLEEVDFRE
ncbi:MAG: hypothetical protein ACI81P_001824 [Neolewinella sp.]|jgi:hypothetical protein